MFRSQDHPLVMIAGCPRSGSTILSQILALSHRTGYVEEPLNYQTGIEGTDEPFVYLHSGSELVENYDSVVRAILNGTARYKTSYFQPEHPDLARQVFYALFINRYHLRYKASGLNPFLKTYIAKDPTASLSAEYLHETFGYTILITIRHPCAVVASHMRLGWDSPLKLLLSKPGLLDQLSADFKRLQLETLDEIESLAWYWRAINEMLLRFAQAHPDFKLVEHEDFSMRPGEVSRALYRWLDLPYTPFVAQMVNQLTSPRNKTAPKTNRAHTLRRNSRANSQRWRQLLPADNTERILAITSGVYDQLRALPNNLAHDLPGPAAV